MSPPSSASCARLSVGSGAAAPPACGWEAVAQAIEAAIASRRRPKRLPVLMPGRSLLPRQRALDHRGTVAIALLDLTVDGEDPQHAALRRREVEARVTAEA